MTKPAPDATLMAMSDEELIGVISATPASRVAAMTQLSQHVEAEAGTPPSTRKLEAVFETLLRFALIRPQVG